MYADQGNDPLAIKYYYKALAIDKENGNTLWWDAICKEMRNVRPAFEKWEKNEQIPYLFSLSYEQE